MSAQSPPTTNSLPRPSSSSSSFSPLQLSIPLPNTHLPINIHLHLTITPTSILLFLTTASGGPAPSSFSSSSSASFSGPLMDTSQLELDAAAAAGGGIGTGMGMLTIHDEAPTTTVGNSPLGSFVVAMPSLRNSTHIKHPITTPLYTAPATLETASRIASILAAKTRRQVYVGNSMDFGAAGAGGVAAEVMEGIMAVVEVVMAQVERFEREWQKRRE